MTVLCACSGSGAKSAGNAADSQASAGNGSAAAAGSQAGDDTSDSKTSADGAQEAGRIIIGSKDFTENEIVAEIYALALEDAGFTVERRMNIASSVIHTSLVNKEVELYPEYTGTGLLSILQMDLITDPDQVYETVKAAYEEQFGVTWLDYAPANDGQGIFVSRKVSDEYGITTISDLQAHAADIRFASQGEFDEREDGIPGLEKVYGPFAWKSSKVYDNGLKYQVVENDEADAAPAYTTEGRLVETDKFVLLEDDKQVWPPYNIAPVVRDEVLEAYPQIAEILNPISASLDTETVTALNAQVDIDQEEYEDVALDFYESIK
ncbi:MAG: glycine/betaine ABC transporter substrate-binding protein [Lachnospiraceae bacterium]|nr:glycine/betaine ABC transporter substrate-binding protein [Sarcina sp.]MBR3187223.1 glycine/betaine ABC transporter substrate-binding protein [Lachnospiraceae bacterium]